MSHIQTMCGFPCKNYRYLKNIKMFRQLSQHPYCTVVYRWLFRFSLYCGLPHYCTVYYRWIFRCTVYCQVSVPSQPSPKSHPGCFPEFLCRHCCSPSSRSKQGNLCINVERFFYRKLPRKGKNNFTSVKTLAHAHSYKVK